MKTNEVIAHINLPGVNGKEIRDYARKYFTKTDAGWDFNEAQVKELDQHFHQKWTFRQTKIDEVIAETAEQKSWNSYTDMIHPPKNKQGGLTPGETAVMDFLVMTGWYAEEGFSDVTADEVAEAINKPIASVKGYLGSLVKKEMIQIDDPADNPGGFAIIYAGKNTIFNDELKKYQY